jgi:hypothetical protein
VEEVKELYDGHCAICGVPEIECNRKLNLDHDHSGNGVARGFLCSRCNMAIGHCEDNPELLLKAALYLERNANLIEKESV